MAWFIHFLYWLHWALDIAFAIACLSVIFKPYLIAKVYVLIFVSQQLILNGCLMTKIENHVQAGAGWTTSPNRFIMAEVLHGPVIWAYKGLFLAVALWLLLDITKEIRQWMICQQSKRAM